MREEKRGTEEKLAFPRCFSANSHRRHFCGMFIEEASRLPGKNLPFIMATKNEKKMYNIHCLAEKKPTGEKSEETKVIQTGRPKMMMMVDIYNNKNV